MRYLFNRICCLLFACCIFTCIVGTYNDADDLDSFDVELGDTYISSAHDANRFDRESYPLPTEKRHHVLPEHRHNKKYQNSKFHSFKTIVPETVQTHIVTYTEEPAAYATTHSVYKYLFFREINPPPPRHCA